MIMYRHTCFYAHKYLKTFHTESYLKVNFPLSSLSCLWASLKTFAFNGLNPSPFSKREGYKEFLEAPLIKTCKWQQSRVLFGCSC